MPVYIHRHFDAAVSELIFDVGQWLACLNQKRRETVPQIMESDSPQAGLFKALKEVTILHGLHIWRTASLITENPLRDFVFSFGEPLFHSPLLQI